MKHATQKTKRHIMTGALSSIIAAGLLTCTATAYGAVQNNDGSITVESGDTLSEIAQQFGGTYHEYTGYASGDPDLIYPGETVTRTVSGQKVSDDRLEALAQAVLRGEYGNNPERADRLTAEYDADTAAAVQQLVNHKLAGNAGIPDTVRGMVTTTTTVEEPAQATAGVPLASTSGADTTVKPGITTPTTVTQPHDTTTDSTGAKRVWVVDVAGHYELVTMDEDVYETRQIAPVTVQELVRDAYDETVEIPARYETVTKVVTPAYDEQVKVKDAYVKTVYHPATYTTIPAVTHEEQVVDVPEHEEQQLVSEAYDEQVVDTPERTEQKLVKEGYTYTVNHPAEYTTVTIPAVTHEEQQLVSPERTETRVVTPEHTEQQLVTTEQTIEHPAVTHEEPVYEQKQVVHHVFDDGYEVIGRAPTEDENFDHGGFYSYYSWETVQTGTQTIVDTPAWTETIPATYQTVTIPAVTEEVIVPAVYQTITVVDSPERQERQKVSDAWDETITIPDQYETVTIPATYRTVHHDAVYETVTVPATYKTVMVEDAPERTELVRDAWSEQVEVPAEYTTVHHDAVTEDEQVLVAEATTRTVHHDAEYRTVELVPATTVRVKVGTKQVQKQGAWIPEQGHWETI